MQKVNPVDFYDYFRGCYKLDYKEFNVDNILSTKYKYKWFVPKKEELFNESLPYIPYDNSKVSDLEKEMELYKLEKKLFYGCFFVLGKNENPFIKDKRICAPLILFPATILTIDELKYLEIDINSFIVNRAILHRFENKDDSLSTDLFLEELTEEVINNKHDDNIWLKQLIEKYFSNIHTDELSLYPNVWSQNKIKSTLTEKEYDSDEYQIVSAAGTVLVDKAESSLRVLNDLKEIASNGEFNSSLKELLSDNTEQGEFDFSYYKSRLNIDQFDALKRVYMYNNTVIVGPPGTGKSYTITSIISDAVVNGKSVLVVSKTKQAVEVLRAMLQDEFKLKDYLIHTTGNKYKISLKAKIRRYLSGISSRKSRYFDESKIRRLYNELEDLEGKFSKLIERELELSDLEFSDDLSFFDQWRRLFLKYGFYGGDSIWKVFDKINVTSKELDRAIKIHSKQKIETNIESNSRIFRRDISLFYDSLEATNFTEYKRIIREVKHHNILKVFPIWLANLSDLNSVLPLEKDLFDVVIIDEATQCDIASALPAIYRAKKAVIVGDPNQLRHYSFVSGKQQQGLLEKHNLPKEKIFDYRNRSILDFYISKVQDQDQVTFLREHFRSTPSLIEFSNQQFYDGQLEVIKSTPKHTTHTQIELIELRGKRNKKGVNEIEANAVFEKLDKLLAEYENEKQPPTIGIISLFSSQVSHINKLLREKYSTNTLKKFNLICGTPYNFQGSEREIVLISFVVDDDTHHSAFIHANKPEVLNVAITRAKSFQFIFKSVSDSKLNKDTLLAKYFDFVKNFIHYNEETVDADDFQEEVAKELKAKGYQDLKFGYPVAGSILDILLVHKEKNYFIDLIGYPGRFKEAFSLERYKTLGRTGIKSFPLHYSFWKKNKVEAMNRLIDFIK